MRIIIIFGILLLISNSSFSQNKKLIAKKNISFEVNSTININDCILWHVDLTELKSTVLYKNHIISMGLYGGFVAINSDLKSIDNPFSKKLNSDLFTNLSVRHDTLFAEKFDEIFFLSDKDTSWMPYNLTEPIALFDILLEDEKYVFYSISQGEWGTILFVYDKEIKKLRVASYHDEPKCIYYRENGYYINASLRHGFGSSTFKRLQNIQNLNFISESNKNKSQLSLQSHFLNLPVTDYPDISFDAKVDAGILIDVLPIDYTIMVANSFKINNEYYHFTYFNDIKKPSLHNKTYITKVVNEKLEIVDSLEIYRVNRTRSFDKYTIIESYFLDDGYYLSYDDTLFYITFYNTSDEHQKNKSKINQTCICEETFINDVNFKRQFTCELDSKTIINSFGSNDHRDLIIKKGNRKRKLLLNSKWNTLSKAFKNNDNWNLYFKNLGNIDHKYGLIEIYNLDRFIKLYSKK
jgi:hypothetical protein